MKTKLQLALFPLVILFGVGLKTANATPLAELAQQGDTDAQVLLGYEYLSGGPGIEPNTERAKYWMRKAAEQGDVDAQGVLGTLYYTEKNYAAAAPFLTQACQQNNAQACIILNKLPKK